MLDLQDNKIDDASILKDCTTINSLTINDNNISDINFIGNLASLVTVNLSSNSFSNLPDFSKLIQLNSLDLSGCPNLSNLSGLDKLIINEKTTLRILNLTNCSAIEGETSTGYSNSDLIAKLTKAGCSSIITTGTRL